MYLPLIVNVVQLTCFFSNFYPLIGFPGDAAVKNLPANAGDTGLIPDSRRFPGEGNRNPLQYSRLGNPTDRGAWRARVHGVTKSRIQLSD